MVQRRRVSKRWVWVLVSAFATIPTAAVVASFAIPHVQRWQMLRRITSADLAERERGLNYLIQFASRDDRLRRGAIERLDVPDTDHFLQIAGALDFAGYWKRPVVPDDAWLRWLGVLASADGAASRLIAVERLAVLTDLADRDDLRGVLDRLLTDAEAAVRYRAMRTAALLYGASREMDPYTQWFRRAAGDDNPTIAAGAWIVLGVLRAADDLSLPDITEPDEQDPLDAVHAAALWARLRTDQSDAGVAIKVLSNQQADAPVRAMAAYALHLCSTADAADALLALSTEGMDGASWSAESLLVAWRAILAMPPEKILGIDPLAFEHTPETDAADENDSASTAARMLRNAWMYRLGQADPDAAEDLLVGGSSDPVVGLAVLEGLAPGRSRVVVSADSPDLLRIAAVAVSSEPDPADLRPVFAATDSAVRDLACVVAAERFSTAQLDPLVESLLNDFSDHAKQSGGVLAGLTGLQSKILARKADLEDVWAVREVMQLGLWMQGQLPERSRSVAGMLTRDDLPTTTVLLAMLHMGDPAALDYLFLADHEEPIDLVELLDQRRWWGVLRRYLPGTDHDSLTAAPPFWVWADPALERFQVETLRWWYLLHRERYDQTILN